MVVEWAMNNIPAWVISFLIGLILGWLAADAWSDSDSYPIK
jgi:hypothetical protein